MQIDRRKRIKRGFLTPVRIADSNKSYVFWYITSSQLQIPEKFHRQLVPRSTKTIRDTGCMGSKLSQNAVMLLLRYGRT